MRAINHALTGSIIGLAVGQPILAMPLAVASHFVCDAIPHYGLNLPGYKEIKSQQFKNLIYVDAILCFALVMTLFIARPHYWLLASICAFLAASPDLISANRYFKVRAGKKWKPSLYAKFAHGIQWFERPIGAVVEMAWLIAALILLTPFIVR